MVILTVKRNEASLFLHETTLESKVEDVLTLLCHLVNGRLKVLRLCEAVVSLADHGIAKPPNMRGLLDEQVAELKLVDPELERCEPAGGFVEQRDPVGFRVGRAPTGAFRGVLTEAAMEAERLMKNPQHFLSMDDITRALQDLSNLT